MTRLDAIKQRIARATDDLKWRWMTTSGGYVLWLGEDCRGFVGGEEADAYVFARTDLPALLAVVEAAKDLQSACYGRPMSTWSEGEEHALNALEAVLAPLLQEVEG